MMADGGSVAEDHNGGEDGVTTCDPVERDRHRFSGYALSVPAGATVTGIEVRLDAFADSTTRSPFMCVQLSSDGGATWTSQKLTPTLSTSQQTYILGGSADTWGRAWSPADFGSNFRMRITNVADSTLRDFFLDWTAVRVYYWP
jgi:hypothetical protein